MSRIDPWHRALLKLVLILMMATASSGTYFSYFRKGRVLFYGATTCGCDARTPILLPLLGGHPLLTVGGPFYSRQPSMPYWIIPHDRRPGPIRHLIMGCVTVNESLPQKVGPYGTAVEIRRVFLAPCNGKPAQDFIMPDDEWMHGCGGRIKWAVDEKFYLAAVAREAVLIESEKSGDGQSHKWNVDFWERRWVLTASTQLTLVHACSGMTVVLLLFQVFRLLRTSLHVFKLFVDACPNNSVDIRLAAFATVGGFATKARQLIRSSNAHNDVEVLNLYNSRRVARIQRTMWLIQPVLSIVLLGNIRSRPYAMIWSIFNLPEEKEFGGEHVSPSIFKAAMDSTGLLPTVVLFAWATFFSAWPRLLSARTLDCSNIALAVTWVLQFAVVSQGSARGNTDTMAWMDIVQVLTATLLGNAALATVLQVILAAVHIHSRSSSRIFVGSYFSQQLTLLVLFLIMIWLMDMETWAEAKATVGAKRADSSSRMVSRLLGSMCDAVVHVDESLCVGAAGSQQLASLLMHQDSHISPPERGLPLMNVVKSEDHQRLRDFFARELDAARAGFGAKAPIESSLHIHLRDAFGISVPVELFCSCSLPADGGGVGPLQYLLGIKELESSGPAFHSREPGRERSLQDRQVNMAPRLGQISELDTSSSDDDASSESSMVHMDLSVWVDLDSEKLTCLHWNPNAVLLLQPQSEKASFLDWIRRKDRQDFSNWLQVAMENVGSAKMITLQLPCNKGNTQRRVKSKKHYFICSVSENSEELPETSFPSSCRVGRLDLQAITRAEWHKPPHLPILNMPHLLLWIDLGTHFVLKTEHAPVFILPEGSHVVCHQEANQGDSGSVLFSRICSQILLLGEEEEEECKDFSLGKVSFLSEGYRLHAETTLADWGENWQGTAMSWCLLRLAGVRLSPAPVLRSNSSGREKINI